MSFQSLDQKEEKELAPGFHARCVHTDNITIAYWRIEEGSTLPLHNHPHEQTSSVIDGTFELTVGDETRIVKSGDVAVIPSDVKHTGKALTDCYIIDVFHPAREDYR